jgi:hypothetical protein
MSVLDREGEFRQVVARAPAQQPTRINDACAALVGGLYAARRLIRGHARR